MGGPIERTRRFLRLMTAGFQMVARVMWGWRLLVQRKSVNDAAFLFLSRETTKDFAHGRARLPRGTRRASTQGGGDAQEAARIHDDACGFWRDDFLRRRKHRNEFTDLDF
jgi:hypothetical protein